jgi:type IV pilus assembly protein PilB
MSPGESERLGELLVEEGVITHEELVRAVSEGGVKGTVLSTILESCSHARRSELAAFLASDYRVPEIDDLRKLDLYVDAARLVPEELARKHEMIPILRMGNILCVAKANFYNRAAVQELRKSTGLKVKILHADEVQVRAAIEIVYKGKRGDLPAPTSRSKKETTIPLPPVEMRPVQRPPAGGDLPLISSAGDNGVDEVIEIMDAIRIPSQEYSIALRDPVTKLVLDFDRLFRQGEPVEPHWSS